VRVRTEGADNTRLWVDGVTVCIRGPAVITRHSRKSVGRRARARSIVSLQHRHDCCVACV